MAFQDDFNRTDEDLENSANWTRVGGTAGRAAVSSNALGFFDSAETTYLCPDQGTPDHYTQNVKKQTAGLNFFDTCVRITDNDNFIGVRWQADPAWHLFKRVSGTFTDLGNSATAASVGDVVRVEANSDDEITFLLNSTIEIGPISVAEHTAVTRQGMHLRTHAQNPALDDWEAGALAAAVGDVKVAVVSRVLNTGAAATTDFTKSGFGTPKAAIITLTYADGDDGNSDTEYRICIGLTDFTNSRFITAQAEDASAAEDANNRKGVNDAYFLLDAAGGDDGHGDASAITDGVRLTNQAAFSRAVFVEITMFGGADLAVDCGTHVLTNVTVGQTNQTTTGIDADIIRFIGIRSVNEDSTGAGIKASFGVASTGREASQSIVNRCQSFTVDDNDPVGDPFSAIRNNRCVAVIQASGAANWAIELTAADANTFTTTVRDVDVNANNEVYYLALALAPDATRRKSEVGSIDSPTASGDWSKTGLGFKPGYVGLGINRLTAENTVAGDATAGSVGFSHNSGSGEETCHSVYDEDAAGTINTNNCFRSRAVYLFEDDGATIAYDLSHSSFDSDGWTYSQIGTPSATARKWDYLAIEEAVAVVAAGRILRNNPMMVTLGRMMNR